MPKVINPSGTLKHSGVRGSTISFGRMQVVEEEAGKNGRDGFAALCAGGEPMNRLRLT
jgi:hypothetical protein